MKEDGSVKLNIQWAISCIGNGHLERSRRTGREVIKKDSGLRHMATNLGLPKLVLDWLCGEKGLEGPNLHVPTESAGGFWKKS